MHRFSVRVAGTLLLVAFTGMTIVHVLVLRGVVPYQLLWGGLADTNNIASLSLFAIGVSLFVVFVTAQNMSYISPFFPRVMRLLMWVICGYLFFNTIGNVLSQTAFEQYYVAPLTGILTLCAARVAWRRE